MRPTGSDGGVLLALDTSTGAVTAAVCRDRDGEPGTDTPGPDVVLAVASRPGTNRHAETLAPLVAEVLEQAGTTAAAIRTVAVGVGPGPFTGLRVGLVTAAVLGLTTGAPVLGVCSLDALAQAALEAGHGAGDDGLLVATDARRREVYWAGYHQDPDRPGWVRRIQGPAVDVPGEVPRRGRPVVGRGAVLYPDVLGDGADPPVLDVDAGVLGRLALRLRATGAALAPQPLYLRRPDAQEPAGRKRVLR